jgi:hypothetical protein
MLKVVQQLAIRVVEYRWQNQHSPGPISLASDTVERPRLFTSIAICLDTTQLLGLGWP